MVPTAPEVIDNALEATLKQVLGPWLGSNETARYDKQGELVDIDVRYVVSDQASLRALAEAAVLADAALTPSGNAIAVKELTRLGLLTKSRAEDGRTMEARLLALADEVAAYPADVVIDACRYWARAETWFPSWAELKDQFERGVKRRRRLRDAVLHPQKGVGHGRQAQSEI